MTLRSTTGNIEYNSTMKFATKLGYRTDHPKEAICSENYWLNSRHMFEAGDEIHVSAIRDDGTWDKAWFEFSSSTDMQVSVEQITDWRHGGEQVIRGLKAVHKGFGRWNLEDESGKVFKANVSKAEALSFAIESEEAA